MLKITANIIMQLKILEKKTFEDMCFKNTIILSYKNLHNKYTIEDCFCQHIFYSQNYTVILAFKDIFLNLDL